MAATTEITLPRSIITVPAEHSERLGITRFSMTNDMRDKLRDMIAPFVQDSGVPPSPLNLPGKEKECRARLREIAESCFPPSELDRLRTTMRGETISPFIIENLPHDIWDESKTAARRIRSQTRQLMSDVISEAIFAAADARYAHNEVLIRRVDDHQKGKSFKGNDMHTDGFDVSMLSAVMNEEHANLQLIDLAAVIRAMPKKMRTGIAVTIEHSPLQTNEYGGGTLDTIDPDRILPYTVIDIDRKFSDPEALATFDRLLKEHTVEIDLQPGQLLCISNNKIFHKGTRGTLQAAHAEPQQITRVLAGNFANL